MDEDNALAIARALSRRGVRCRLARATPDGYGLLVALHHGRQAVWNLHRDTLEARVLRADGTLIGFVSLRVDSDATGDEVAGLVAQQRYERLSLTGGYSHLSDPGRRAAPPVRTQRPTLQRQHGRRTPLFVVIAGVLLALLLLILLLLTLLGAGA